MKDYQLFILIFTIVLSTILILKKGLNVVNNKFIILDNKEIPQVVDKRYSLMAILLLILILIVLIVR